MMEHTTDRTTPRGILHLTFATLSQETRHVPLDTLTAFLATAEARQARDALDHAVLHDDLLATKHAGRRYILAWRAYARCLAEEPTR